MDIYANKHYSKFDVSKFSPFLLMSSSMTPNDFLATASFACGGLDSGLFLAEDAYNPYQNGMIISAFSGDNKKIGKGIITHELSHIVSSLLNQDAVSKKSREKLIKARECVNGRTLIPDYNSNSPTGMAKNLAFDHATSNEDFADYLSSKSLSNNEDKELGKANSFYQCTYFPIKKGVLQNIPLDFRVGAPHTVGFYRLINALLDRDIEIPAVCKSVLENYGHRYSPVKCD
jgi:hypothetical protein